MWKAVQDGAQDYKQVPRSIFTRNGDLGLRRADLVLMLMGREQVRNPQSPLLPLLLLALFKSTGRTLSRCIAERLLHAGVLGAGEAVAERMAQLRDRADRAVIVCMERIEQTLITEEALRSPMFSRLRAAIQSAYTFSETLPLLLDLEVFPVLKPFSG